MISLGGIASSTHLVGFPADSGRGLTSTSIFGSPPPGRSVQVLLAPVALQGSLDNIGCGHIRYSPLLIFDWVGLNLQGLAFLASSNSGRVQASSEF